MVDLHVWLRLCEYCQQLPLTSYSITAHLILRITAFSLTITYSKKNKKSKKIITRLCFQKVYILLNLQSLPVISMYVYLTVGGNDPLETLFIITIQKTTYQVSQSLPLYYNSI